MELINVDNINGGAEPGEREGRTCALCGRPYFASGFEISSARGGEMIHTGSRCEACLKQELQNRLNEGCRFVRWLF